MDVKAAIEDGDADREESVQMLGIQYAAHDHQDLAGKRSGSK